MSEQQSKLPVIAQSVLVLGLLLVADFYLAWGDNLSHFAVAVLGMQLICLLAFHQGQICPGQRGRLVGVNLIFALYWLAWLIVNNGWLEHNAMINIVNLCGLAVAYCMHKQQRAEQIRSGLLKMAALVAFFGILAYAFSLSLQPIENFLLFNPISQILLAVVLANLALVLARNRLQGFIGLQRLIMIALIAFNALIFFVFLLYLINVNALAEEKVFAYMAYLMVHLVAMAILAFSLLQGKKLNFVLLIILQILTESLPLLA